MDGGTVTVIDVRPEVEYEQGHICGARSVPVETFRRRLAELPRDVEVVAYCRGPYCVYSDEAVRLLHQHGFRARCLDEGFPEWRAAGYPVETREQGEIARALLRTSAGSEQTRREKR
ncbi:MAG: Rhodanese-like domain [Rubrobacteraceae bacterium]|jgi:rhodanese-related sulfurtransferase|nr:Rhodanese-like domain [Rubrobacteraceae bacterium]